MNAKKTQFLCNAHAKKKERKIKKLKKKTQFMAGNIPAPNSIKARYGTLLKKVTDYNYF